MGSVTRQIAKHVRNAYCRAGERRYTKGGHTGYTGACGKKATKEKGKEGLCRKHWLEGWLYWVDHGLRSRWESERGGAKRMTARAHGVSVKRLRALLKRERLTSRRHPPPGLKVVSA